MRFPTLNEWLAWQESLHPRPIDLGLDRVRGVADKMGLSRPGRVVVSVGGTNGKGSCVAILERALIDAGWRTGAYTSPHLMRYTERIRIQGEEIAEGELCAAFQTVDEARGEISLSYFEFGTLAALQLFQDATLDAAVLEIGLGGRLDAVNIIDADVSLITSLSVDHQGWLGEDRESIGREKAGILRSGRPGVCIDRDPPNSVTAHAGSIGAPLLVLGRDFDWTDAAGDAGDRWNWSGPDRTVADLPAPGIPGKIQKDNASGVLMVLDLLGLDPAATRDSIAAVSLSGRHQRFESRCKPGVQVVLDVAHNPGATRVLFEGLGRPAKGRQTAVFACMGDKDLDGLVAATGGRVDGWYVGSFDDARALPAPVAAAALRRLSAGAEVAEYGEVGEALTAALDGAEPGDRIVVFGSFRTVAAAMEQRL